jgi:SAM-dependent methyltransferase
MAMKESLRGVIRGHYAKVARGNTGGCCVGGCGCGAAVSAAQTAEKLGYASQDLAAVPADANMGLGCGNPVAIAALREGETVLDLGCGGGLDCFLASRKVKEHGYVIGVDMTPEMIGLARSNAKTNGLHNLDFRLGEIEHLPVADETVDVILSNCVVNLSVDKGQVYREAFRVLKPGGRLCISDVVALKPLPEALQADERMVSGCIGGAELADTIRAMLTDAGFANVVIRPKEKSRAMIRSWGFSGNPEDYVASCDIFADKPDARKTITGG